MSTAEDVVLTRVVATATELPRRSLLELADTLARCADWTGTAMPALPRESTWHELRREAIRVGVPPARVADLLRGAAAMEGHAARSMCEVAWTGPTPALSSLRRTEQTLLEVIDTTQHGLWLVSFAAYRVESVQRALVAAAARGCRTRIVLESEAESGGRLSSGGVDSLPADVSRCSEVYVWPREMRVTDERGRFGTLHAKCAVADGKTLFVGSANLTEFAFELNIELGVLVRNADAAGIVDRQLQWLVETGTLGRAT